ncbi:MAG TPA: hypothetical protein VM513_03665 [Kofleriaceae bacterium]|nr:hypothetical protein [Kofleriaceae bacterium]
MSFADKRDRAGNRQRRIVGRAHACHRGKKIGTVIRHAHDLGVARAAITLAIPVIEEALRRCLVTGTSPTLRLRPRDRLARRAAVPLPAIAGPAYAEQDLALLACAALDANSVAGVHRIPGARTRNLLGTSASSIVCSKPASIG